MRQPEKPQDQRKDKTKGMTRRPRKVGPKLSDVVAPMPWAEAKRRSRQADKEQAEENATIVKAARSHCRKSLRRVYRARYGEDVDLLTLINKAMNRYSYELRQEAKLIEGLERVIAEDTHAEACPQEKSK